MKELINYQSEESIIYVFTHYDEKPQKKRPVKIKNCPQVLKDYIEYLYFNSEDNHIKNYLCGIITEGKSVLTQKFDELFTKLKAKDFNENDLADIIAYIYSRNYDFFNGQHCTDFFEIKLFNPTRTKYNELCQYANLSKSIIDEEGKIIPQNIKLNPQTKNLLTFNGFLSIPDEALSLIINTSQKKYLKNVYQESENKTNEESLNKLLRKVEQEEDKITIKDIETIEKLMKTLKYPDEEIKNIITTLTSKYKERQYNRKISNQIALQNAKEKALSNLQLYFKYIKGQLHLDYNDELTDNDIQIIIESLNTLGYPKERINVIINTVIKHNKTYQETMKQEKLLTTKNKVFDLINKDETIKYSADINVLYENALSIINDLNSDITLIYFINLLKELIIKIDEYLISLLDKTITNELDLDELKLFFLEIDQCFEKIYCINPLVKIRLQK